MENTTNTHDLAESLDSEAQEEIDAYWIEEVERRNKEIEAGMVRAIPGEEVMARLLSRYKR